MPNIAVVVLDTLRNDRFDEYFSWINGARFANTYSTSHWTIPAHGSLFTGKYPSEIGSHAKSQSLNCSEEAIAEAFYTSGYTTRFWCANHNLAFWEGWDRGFSTFVPPSELHPDFENGIDWSSFLKSVNAHSWMKYPQAVTHAVQADCSTITALKQGYRQMMKSDADGGARDVLSRLQRTNFGTDEFLFMNLMETHTPYYPPEKDEGGSLNVVIGDAFAKTVPNENQLRRGYDMSAKVLSRIYKQIFAKLQEHFDFIVTLSDHGELLGEHGLWNHGYGLYPELVHIPLVISGENIDEKIDNRPVTILDIHQTIADLGGVTVNSRGRNLFQHLSSQNFLTEYDGFVPAHYEQFERKGVPSEEYKERDSHLRGILTTEGIYGFESHDQKGVQTVDTTSRDGLAKQIAAKTDSVERRSVTTDSPEINKQVKEHLKDLGYA